MTATPNPISPPAVAEPTAPPTKRRRFSPKLKRLVILALLTAGVCLGGFTAYSFAYAEKVLPHARIDGVTVGGMTRQQAEEAIRRHEQDFLERQLSLTYEGKSWEVSPKELSITIDHDASLDEAYLYGKQGGFSRQVRQLAAALLLPRSYRSTVTSVSQVGREVLASKGVASIETATAETSLSFIPGKVTVVPGKTGRQVDYNALEVNIAKAFKDGSSGVSLSLADFKPEVTPEQAEEARVVGERMLSDRWQVKVGDAAYSLEAHDLAQWLGTQVQRSSDGKAIGLEVTVKEELLQAFVDNIVAKSEKKPVNAKIKGENGALVVVEDAKDGMRVLGEATKLSLRQALFSRADQITRVVTAATETVPAYLRRDNLAELGIRELIGTATTDFAGSPTNRKFNIGVGQRALSGSVVKNGEVYSTTGTLGPIEESTGYLPELVIKDNRTIPEAGGGLCQVSTTLFRAVLNAGLPVVERTNHSYRVGYYERGVGPGLDATVYDPSPDFKWRNDTGYAVYVQSYIVGDKITFELYGTKDGRVATISKPEILKTIPVGSPIQVETDTLYKGETKQIETAHDGAVTTVTYTVERGGQQIYRREFKSTYKAWPAQFLVGTKERPAA